MTTALSVLVVGLALLAGQPGGPQKAAAPPKSKPTTVAAHGKIVQWRLDELPKANASVTTDGSKFLRQAGFVSAWQFDRAIANSQSRVGVGVIAAGFAQHAQLKDRYKDDEKVIWQTADLAGPSKRIDLARAQEGTFVAGLIAGDSSGFQGVKGCSSFADIYPLSYSRSVTFPPTSPPTEAEKPEQRLQAFDDVKKQLEVLVAKKGVRVIYVDPVANYGFRKPTADEESLVRQLAERLAAVVDQAEANGILLVSPAGNDSLSDRKVDGKDSPGDRKVHASWASPINYLGLKEVNGRSPRANILVVESVNAAGQPSRFSNDGGHIAAPGEDVMGLTIREDYGTPWAGYGVRSGTGPAAAQVAALAANVFAYNPELKYSEVVDHLRARKPSDDDSAPTPVIKAFDTMVRAKKTSWEDLADIDGNGRVDREDFRLLEKAIKNLSGDPSLRADLNCDGRVTIGDKNKLWNPKIKAYQNVTDVEVMMEVWKDTEFAPASALPKLLKP